MPRFACRIALLLSLLVVSGSRAADEKASGGHWAFRPITKPATPAVKNKAWVRNPIDAFVLAKLEAAGLEPSSPTDGATLLRRVTFDLTGLPPTPEEIDGFLKEYAAKPQAAFAGVIDRLLASPHYGERWGRHWLDVVRYADSAGYEIDNFYHHAWLYRDYVVKSFNDDKPFDRFVQEQVAGDELWPDSEEAKLATGFATVGPYAYEGGIARPKVVEYQRLTDLADTMGQAFLGLTVGCARCHDHKFDPISQQDYFGLQVIFAGSEPKPLRAKSGEAKVLAARANPEPVPVLKRGEIESPLNPAAPAIFRSLPGGRELRDVKQPRAALAKWLTSPENPLTARVIVNRVWQWHFGAGLVRTPDDFGRQGEPPTHPELLDYLARDLIDHGWSLKRLHRMILDSNTYRQVSAVHVSRAIDPDNRLLGRMNRRRLEAEAIWDNLHAAAGTLNRQVGGPAVVPPIDAKALDTLINKNWKVTDDPKQFTRRGLYLVVRRSLTLPFFETFNVSIPIEGKGRRDVTVVSAQALTLLNGPVAVEQARHFAGRLLRECGDNPEKIVALGWRLAFNRPASAEELKMARDFLSRRERALGDEDFDRLPTPLGDTGKAKPSPERAASLIEWCLALFNANEFVYVD
jgi:hypothetical protein